MARKVDPGADAGDLRLPYDSAILGALVRIMTVMGSPEFQRSLTPDLPVPDDPNAIPTLYALAGFGPLRPSTLARYLHVSAPTASRIVERLVGTGLVTRMPDPHDSRASNVTLTPLGAATTAELFRIGDELMTELLSSWSQSERDTLAAQLSRFAADLITHASHNQN